MFSLRGDHRWRTDSLENKLKGAYSSKLIVWVCILYYGMSVWLVYLVEYELDLTISDSYPACMECRALKHTLYLKDKRREAQCLVLLLLRLS